ncbi:MAG: hypothetical protein HN348_00930 [Proteobacteria bacterium]|jgi:hypothetical protein|nr:hypothetical protein [Pseudomonadota bacterium]
MARDDAHELRLNLTYGGRRYGVPLLSLLALIAMTAATIAWLLPLDLDEKPAPEREYVRCIAGKAPCGIYALHKLPTPEQLHAVRLSQAWDRSMVELRLAIRTNEAEVPPMHRLLATKLSAKYPARARTLEERLNPEMIEVLAEISKKLGHRWTPSGAFGLPVQPVNDQDVEKSRRAALENWLRDLAAERDWSNAPTTPPTKEALLRSTPKEEQVRRSEIASKMCYRWDFCDDLTKPTFDWEWAQNRATHERDHLPQALQAKLDDIYDEQEQDFKSLEYSWEKSETARTEHNDSLRLWRQILTASTTMFVIMALTLWVWLRPQQLVIRHGYIALNGKSIDPSTIASLDFDIFKSWLVFRNATTITLPPVRDNTERRLAKKAAKMLVNPLEWEEADQKKDLAKEALRGVHPEKWSKN